MKAVNNSKQIIHLTYGGTLHPGENELSEENYKANKNHPGFKQLVEVGKIEIDEPVEETTEEKKEEWPKQTSPDSPWYELSNGEKIMGQKKAEKAQKELDEKGDE